MNLEAHLKRQPIMDKPYQRHLETSDTFHAVNEAREAHYRAIEATNAAMDAEEAAALKLEAEIAIADLLSSMEDL